MLQSTNKLLSKFEEENAFLGVTPVMMPRVFLSISILFENSVYLQIKLTHEVL